MIRLSLGSIIFAGSLSFACATVTDESITDTDGIGGTLGQTGGAASGGAASGGAASGGAASGGATSSGGVFGVSGGTTGSGGSGTGGSATGGSASGGASTGGAATGGSASGGGSSASCGSLPEWSTSSQCWQSISGGVPKGSEIQFNGKKFTFDGDENTATIYDCNSECPPEGTRAAWCATSQYQYTLIGPC